MYQVQKRDGKIADFDVTKITAAISKAFDALEKQYHPSTIDLLGLNVTAHFEPKVKDGIVSVEDIQDSVEEVLSNAGYADVAGFHGLCDVQHDARCAQARNVSGSA